MRSSSDKITAQLPLSAILIGHTILLTLHYCLSLFTPGASNTQPAGHQWPIKDFEEARDKLPILVG